MPPTRINVSSETAKAFNAATPRQQKRAEVAMLQTLMGRQAALQRLEAIMDAMRANARRRGLTDERLDELLDDRD
jgi:hypothetical protein